MMVEILVGSRVDSPLDADPELDAVGASGGEQVLSVGTGVLWVWGTHRSSSS